MNDVPELAHLSAAERQLDFNENLTDLNSARRMFSPKLSALRCSMPFIPIMQFPNSGVSFQLAPNVAQTVQVPAEAKMVRFSGNQEYYVTRNGDAILPAPVVNFKMDNQSGIIMNPEDAWYYCEEILTFSFISPTTCNMTVSFICQG